MKNKHVLKLDNFLVVCGLEYNFNNLGNEINFIKVDCSGNIRRNFDNLPNSVKSLEIQHSFNVDPIDFLPSDLAVLAVKDTNITNFDNLPLNLKKLYIYGNRIDNINNLPPNLEHLSIYQCTLYNDIINLPKNLKTLYIYGSHLRNCYINEKNIILPEGCILVNDPLEKLYRPDRKIYRTKREYN